MRKRTKARQKTLAILYQSELTKRSMDLAMADYWDSYHTTVAIDSTVKSYTQRLVLGIQMHRSQIDEMIVKYAKNWHLSRMAVIDRNILRLGVYEMMFAEDVPPKVSINEAVELAKRYGDLESGKFVNGILDRIHKSEVLNANQGS